MDPRRSLESELRRLTSGVLEALGLELVEFALRGSSARRVLRVDIDRVGKEGVGVDDCQRVSQALGTAVEEADLIDSAYVLEVSSPGVDRPIRTADDIRRNTGRRVTVTAATADQAQETFCGLLMGQEDDILVLQTEAGDEVRVPLAGIVSARQALEF